MCDIVIIGAGCAGLTAAVYAARAGRDVRVLEYESIGGQISSSPRVENYPGIKSVSGMEFSDALLEQAQSFGAKLVYAQAEKIEKTDGGFAVVTSDGETLSCKSVIIASGAKPRKLGIKGEEELSGKGVSYCAICDGAFHRGKSVAVVGGGSAALQSVEFLSGICEQVYLIHRRAEFRGEQVLAERVSKLANVELRLGYTVSELKGESALSSAVITNGKDTEEIAISGFFVAAGHEPDNARFADLIKLNEKGYIIAGEDCKTSCEGIFAAGDCRTKTVRQLTTAAADGAVAALAAIS